jgi:hypothetical protein
LILRAAGAARRILLLRTLFTLSASSTFRRLPQLPDIEIEKLPAKQFGTEHLPQVIMTDHTPVD